VSAPFHRTRDGIAVELPAHVRATVRQSILLVASMVESGAEEAWRLAPPMFDDPLLEAARAVEGQGSSGSEAALRLRVGEELITREWLSVDEADELMVLVNYCRLVLAESRGSSGEGQVVQDLYDLLGYLLSELIEAVTPTEG
jgi:hypothetical protein